MPKCSIKYIFINGIKVNSMPLYSLNHLSNEIMCGVDFSNKLQHNTAPVNLLNHSIVYHLFIRSLTVSVAHETVYYTQICSFSCCCSRARKASQFFLIINSF